MGPEGYLQSPCSPKTFKAPSHYPLYRSILNPLTTVSTANGRTKIAILFNGDHNDSVIPRFHEEMDLIEFKEFSDIDSDEIALLT